MAANDVRKNLSLFADGRSYIGQIDEFNAPKLTLQTEDFRAGGMDAPIKLTMGMEALDTDFSLFSYNKDVLALFGVAEGNTKSFVAREALESFDGTVTAVVHTMRGKITEMDPGTSKAGAIAPIKFTLNLTYYKLQHGSTVVHEIDIENFTRVINGVDTLAGIASALAIR